VRGRVKEEEKDSSGSPKTPSADDTNKVSSELNRIIGQMVESAVKKFLSAPETKKEHLPSEAEESIPASIFSEKISSLEAIVKYFAEEKKYSYKKISKILNRNERTIWTTYQRAIKKIPGILDSSSEILIPASVISSRKLAVLESIVHFLRTEKKLSLHEISILLHRNERTIWTVDFRAKKKLLKNE
jgi:hypothetical protein